MKKQKTEVKKRVEELLNVMPLFRVDERGEHKVTADEIIKEGQKKRGWRNDHIEE